MVGERVGESKKVQRGLREREREREREKVGRMGEVAVPLPVVVSLGAAAGVAAAAMQQYSRAAMPSPVLASKTAALVAILVITVGVSSSINDSIVMNTGVIMAEATELNVDAMIGCAVAGLDGIAAISALQNYGHYCRHGVQHGVTNNMWGGIENLASGKATTGANTASELDSKDTRGVGNSENQSGPHGATRNDDIEGGDAGHRNDVLMERYRAAESLYMRSTHNQDGKGLEFLSEVVPVDSLDACCLRHQRCYNALSLLATTTSKAGAAHTTIMNALLHIHEPPI